MMKAGLWALWFLTGFIAPAKSPLDIERGDGKVFAW
jgi:hypothetical protein